MCCVIELTLTCITNRKFNLYLTEIIGQILDSASQLYQRKHPASADSLAMLALFKRLVIDRRKCDYLMYVGSQEAIGQLQT